MSPHHRSEPSVRWLVIAEEDFAPADSGGRFESSNLIRAAAASGIRMHILIPGMKPEARAQHQAVIPGATIESIPRRIGWKSHLSTSPYLFVSRPVPEGFADDLIREHARDRFEAVLSVSFRVAHLGEAAAKTLGLPLVVRPHNIESEYFGELAKGASPLRRLPYVLEEFKLRRAERALNRSPIVSLFADIGELDAQHRGGLTAVPVMHVPPFVAPRSMEVNHVRPGSQGGRTILFLGSLDNANNVSAVRWFVRQCWPALRARIPDVIFSVVGRRAPSQLINELGSSAGIQVTADAPDVAPHLTGADVFVNPVRQGAGVNIKMIEAMLAGLPVITTTIGARGMHWQDGGHLVIADDPADFCAAVCELLLDSGERRRLGDAGQEFVVKELDGVFQINRMRAAIQPRRPSN